MHADADCAATSPAAIYRPAAHFVHRVDAAETLYVPGKHGSHCAAPSLGWCEPGGHEVHAAGDA